MIITINYDKNEVIITQGKDTMIFSVVDVNPHRAVLFELFNLLDIDDTKIEVVIDDVRTIVGEW